MHFHSVSKLHVNDVKFKGKMESICQCITLLHVLHLKSDTLTEILQSHYTHYTLKSLQCRKFGLCQVDIYEQVHGPHPAIFQ